MKRVRPESYGIWAGMKHRCGCSTHRQYADYGGRGISVCPEWADSFDQFVTDMGPRPPRASLDRIDNSKGYYKENCRWATHQMQSTNRRNNVVLAYEGVVQCVAAWAKQLGLKENTIRSRIRAGWPIEVVLTRPSRTLMRRT